MRYLSVIITLCLAAACSFEPGLPPTEQATPDQGVVDEDSGADVGVEDVGTSELCPFDGDDDGFGIGPACAGDERDCDDGDPTRFPGAEELCNGRDDDCDGTIDEGCSCIDGNVESCGTDTGACVAGTRTCVDGAFGACVGETGPTDEVCNELDDDCDGTVDEGCECSSGDTRQCGQSTGACSPGTQTCIDGAWGACEGATGPTDETCNGIDDDCDGTPDDNPNDVGSPCPSGIPGICADGIETCVQGAIICVPIESPVAETCNGIDDNCNGNIDENVTRSCMTACGPGLEQCNMGAFGACQVTNPPDETCNGVDDDCDGEIDEDVAEVGQLCDTGALGPCGEGTNVCENGVLKCEAAVGPSPETCDGEDNDCDGDTDEDANGLLLTEDCGACPAGTRVCENGAWTSCSLNNFEVCNGADSNCDGLADNDTACRVVCGDRTAVGTLSCGGVSTCELPGEICGDGIDNDCDGTVDTNCEPDLDDMVYIPGGRFVRGSDPTTDMDAQADEQPQSTITTSPYFIDRTEVSRADYIACVTAGSCSLLRAGCPLQLTNQQGPIGCVTWDQADAYCSWAGKRLPTEAEWERAARGSWDRDVIWPWGNSRDATNGVFDCTNGLVSCTADVDSFPQGASVFGLRHMAGNVAEWVSDYYASNAYSVLTGSDPEQTTDVGLGHVVRGGSYNQGIEFGRVSNRARVDFFASEAEIGFRCAADAP